MYRRSALLALAVAIPLVAGCLKAAEDTLDPGCLKDRPPQRATAHIEPGMFHATFPDGTRTGNGDGLTFEWAAPHELRVAVNVTAWWNATAAEFHTLRLEIEDREGRWLGPYEGLSPLAVHLGLAETAMLGGTLRLEIGPPGGPGVTVAAVPQDVELVITEMQLCEE